jgi:hypothetical protein
VLRVTLTGVFLCCQIAARHMVAQGGGRIPQLAVRAPADIVAYLKEVEARNPGLEHVMIAWAPGTPRDLMLEQLTRFAREVMPAFQ